jgi:hypothetical protein
MGMLFRMLAPKSLKKARRVAHPVSLMTPRSVQRAKMAAVNTANPAGWAKRKTETAVVRSVRNPKPTKRTAVRRGLTPATTAAGAVPILKQTSFPLFENARLSAIAELSNTSDDAGRLEALMLINSMYERQAPLVADLLEDVAERQPSSNDAKAFGSWAKPWMDDAEVAWAKYAKSQNELVASMGNASAQAVADDRATPRLREILQSAAIS